MTFAVSGMRPSQSDAGQAQQLFAIHDKLEEAMSEAERWLHTGAVEVSVWKQVGIPTLKKVVDWERKE